MNNNYCQSRFNCVKNPTSQIDVGGVKIGGDAHIVVQSMTNTKTQDVEASVKQCIQLAEAGCEIIRLTAQNLDAARALKDISKKFRAAGFGTPLVADIHFLPATAMEAVEHVEKIRVNPGNFTDKKLDGKPDYTDAEYEAELDKVRQKFTPLVLRCKELGRALRIGTNHGSLSDRIIRRYGDTSYGMVEAAFEFARICRDLNFHNFCFSFKASNTRIMTQTYRLAVKMMKEEGFSYPLHLGVTEAGFGTDARIKSSMGIGGLLFDGIGDTIRVSLTEDPVEEIPVAKDLARLAESVRAKKAAEQFDEKNRFLLLQPPGKHLHRLRNRKNWQRQCSRRSVFRQKPKGGHTTRRIAVRQNKNQVVRGLGIRKACAGLERVCYSGANKDQRLG